MTAGGANARTKGEHAKAEARISEWKWSMVWRSDTVITAQYGGTGGSATRKLKNNVKIKICVFWYISASRRNRSIIRLMTAGEGIARSIEHSWGIWGLLSQIPMLQPPINRWVTEKQFAFVRDHFASSRHLCVLFFIITSVEPFVIEKAKHFITKP